MSEKLTETQYNLLKEIAENNGFTNYKIEEYSTAAKGDNYVGQILGATIKSNDKNLEVIVKKAPSGEKFRKVVPIRELFLREIYVYDKILNTFITFQKETNLDTLFDSYAPYYGKCEEDYNECLILENMAKNGYGLWNRKVPMNSDHIAFVMSEYGKFHAVSYAMKDKNPELFNEISEFLKQEPSDWEKANMTMFLQGIIPVFQKIVEGDPILEEAFPKLTLGIEKFFIEELQQPKEKMVITHGDCWCNNLLFKYENPNDNKKPSKVCIIDWQMSRYALPVLDIIYFFCTSSPKEILDDYKTYLKIYYDSLSDNLRKMSCDPEAILTFEELEHLWAKCARYGLLLSGFIFKILYVDSENAPEVAENTTSMDDFYKQFEMIGYEEKVNARLLDLFKFMVENNFI